MSNCHSYLRECLATCRGDLASYGQTPAYRASRQRLPERALVSGHLSLEPLWFAGPFLPYEVTDVLDALGRTVATLVDRTLAAGAHNLVWTGASQSVAGVYVVRAAAEGATVSRRVLVVR